MTEPKVWDEDDSCLVHGAFVADPVSPSSTYVQAEAVAVRNAVVSILAMLRSAKLMARD